MKGFVMFPIFTVELKDGYFEMTCNGFLAFIFEVFLAPFWDGEIHITHVCKELEDDEA